MPEKTRLGRCSKPIRISPTHYSAFHTCRPTLSSRSCEQNSENVRVARHVSPPTGTTSPAAISSATAPSGSQATLLPDSILRLIASVRASIYRSASGGVGAPLSAQPQHPRNCLGRSPDAVFPGVRAGQGPNHADALQPLGQRGSSPRSRCPFARTAFLQTRAECLCVDSRAGSRRCPLTKAGG